MAMEKNVKKIAIYGAGNYGHTVINILQKTRYICIVLVCDSDYRKWGKEYENYVISSPNKLFEEEDLDGVFISILSDNHVDEYILSRKKIQIYKKIYELVAEDIYWDVAGLCNARCKYCVTGYHNRKNNSLSPKKSYMSLEKFKVYYKHLYENGIISKESHLGLYNWKEPFLNPDIMDILLYLSREGQKYSLSTNGSIVKLAEDRRTYLKCEQIVFSMPGFSQKSYDYIHGFSFDRIKKNIIKIKKNMLENGFKGEFAISAHIYKFSENEIEELKKWAETEGLHVNAYYPYLAGNSLVAAYFENGLEQQFKKDIFHDLYLNWEDEIDQEKIREFNNPLCHKLTIDEKGNFTLCCMADEFCNSYDVWGSISSVNSYEDYRKLKAKMLESKTCIQCRKYAMAYRVLR